MYIYDDGQTLIHVFLSESDGYIWAQDKNFVHDIYAYNTALEGKSVVIGGGPYTNDGDGCTEYGGTPDCRCEALPTVGTASISYVP